MEKKAIAVRVNGGIAYCEFHDNKAVRMDIFYDREKNILGNIYVGYVKDIVKNIGCAFVEYEKDEKAYLQLNDKNMPVFLNRKNTSKLCQGDRIIIQITKEGVNTKSPVCTTQFELAGKYAVLTHGATGIAFSRKLQDEDFKKRMSEALKDKRGEPFGILIRTNAYGADPDIVMEEIDSLAKEYACLIQTAMTRTKNFLLWEAPSPLMTIVRDLNMAENYRLVTDDRELYDRLTAEKPGCSIELYEDEMLPLHKLYSLQRVFDDVMDRKIWLKSGAYLIIDYTEAMTVIDVNSGKCDVGKDREKTFLKINLEAAEEIARLLSLRNISGIILIDFIDMVSEESRELLLDAMRKHVAGDRIQTNVMDFTRLHLMEITRRKTRDRVRITKEVLL